MKATKLAFTLATAVAFMTACSNNGGQQETSSPSSSAASTDGGSSPSGNTVQSGAFSRYDQPVSLAIGKMVSTQGSNLPSGDTADDNEYYRYVEKKLNVKVTNEWRVENPEAYAQKLSVSIASRQLPDAIIVDEKQLHQLADAGLIEDLTDVYKDYASPQIKGYYESYGDRVLSRATIDGKLMAFPNTQIGGQQILTWIRQDWLDKLNLQEPKTLDELAAVAKAFVDNDPDGNNQKDTYGFLGSAALSGWGTFWGFDPIFGALHAYRGQWLRDASGNISYSSILPEMKTALGKLHDYYQDGILDKQFAIRSDQNDQVASGKAGIVFAPWWIPYGVFSDSIKNDPKAEWKPLSVPFDEKGKFNIYDQNPTAQFLVVKKGYAHPEAIAKVLNVEYQGIRQLDPDSKDIYKGLNVNWANWPFTLQIDYENVVYDTYVTLKKAVDAKDPSSLPGEMKGWYDAIMKNNENPKKDIAAWADSTARFLAAPQTKPDNLNIERNVFFGQTKSMDLKWATLQKLENETFLKIIVGDEPVDKFDDFVKDWKRLGGDQITQEVAAAVKP
ncbi:extracellular solute-binding protein [Cohnella sp. REN36]|uniref:extracellular solute-binding protein n=1 Tax=Cohnella sp. REN36 TaxID=2887347 RepID=UPI001D14C77A|nr:extracellular solute-binding protein [Cohnella sp. REN36]MCC3373547.1 extracellular solute-binding protein [Cohnella sp. REN36]